MSRLPRSTVEKPPVTFSIWTRSIMDPDSEASSSSAEDAPARRSSLSRAWSRTSRASPTSVSVNVPFSGTTIVRRLTPAWTEEALSRRNPKVPVFARKSRWNPSLPRTMLAEVTAGDVPTTTSRLSPTSDILLAEPPATSRTVPSANAGTTINPPFRVTSVTTAEPTIIRLTTSAATRTRLRPVMEADCIMRSTLHPSQTDAH